MKKAIQFIVLTCLASWAVAGVAIWLGLHEAKYATKENIFTKEIGE